MLQRLQWQWTSAGVIDDRGICFCPWEVSPALLADMCQQAIQRLHERRVAEKIGWDVGERACLDVLRHEVLHGFKGPDEARLRHMAMLAAVGGMWTRDRLASAGYPVAEQCPLCGQLDSVLHRAYHCQHPDVVAARAKAAPDWVVQMASSRFVIAVVCSPCGVRPADPTSNRLPCPAGPLRIFVCVCGTCACPCAFRLAMTTTMAVIVTRIRTMTTAIPWPWP